MSKRRKKRSLMQDLTVAFDLDGTLVETAPDLIAATNHVMTNAGLGIVPPEVLRSAISFGAVAMIAKGFEQVGPSVRLGSGVDGGVGIAMRKGETELREKVNAALKAIKANGTYKALNAKYFDFDISGAQ